MNQDFINKIFYSTKGNLDEINALIDAHIQKTHERKISVVENFIKNRLAKNPQVLKLPNLEISSLEAEYLSIYPGVENVEILDLRKNYIGDKGLRAIAKSPVIRNFRQLDLRNNQITREGMLAFVAARNMAQLEKLDLRLNILSGTIWEKRLKKTKRFPKLKEFLVGGL